MDAHLIPRIRLQLEGMKDMIFQAMGVMGSEFGEVVEEEFQKALKSFDFQTEILNASHEAISDIIKYYFKYGEGRDVLRCSIDKALANLFNDNEQ
jgi:hypothetical protein